MSLCVCRRKKYTIEDDMKIIKFILDNNWYSQVGGNVVWKNLDAAKVTFNGLFRQNLSGTETRTDAMHEYSSHLSSHISCSVKAKHKIVCFHPFFAGPGGVQALSE